MADKNIIASVLDELLTEKEAATILRLKNHRTLSVWRCTGRHGLPYVKYGRKVLYRKSDLMAFIDTHLVTSV